MTSLDGKNNKRVPRRRQSELSKVGGLYRNIAYALAKLERYSAAAAHLEFNRTRILNEVLDLFHLREEQLDEESRARLKAVQRQVKKLEKEIRSLNLHPNNLDEEVLLGEYSTQLRTARRDLVTIMEQVSPNGREMNVAAISAVAAGNAPLVYLITTPQGSLAIIIPAAVETLQAKDVLWLDEFCQADLHHLLLNEQNGYLWGQIRGNVTLLKNALNQALPILYSRLMKSLNNRLVERGYRRATLIPGGLLGVLPLHVAGPEDIIFGIAPSAKFLANAQQKIRKQSSPAPSLAAIGNPLPNITPLPQARLEVEQISRYLPVEEQDILLETEATLAKVLEALAGKSYLHFSCHGMFDISDPLKSGLLLSGDDRLTLRDLLDGKANLSAARIAVLSACQTGVSDIQHTPDEVIGITAGFLQAGVPAVIGTLWSVDNRSTAMLMDLFYHYLLEEELPPPEALLRAQKELSRTTIEALPEKYRSVHHNDATARASKGGLTRAPKTADASSKKYPYRHPYYWAAFFFTGAW